jgi:inosine/guanosine/xanthosine phosphorylase family protein
VVNPGGRANLAVILGSGLGKAADGFPVRSSVPFDEMAGLTAPGVEGHEGEFRLCRRSGRDCLFVLGRKHHYEDADGETARIIGYAHSFGARELIVVSAAGSLDRCIRPGEFVLADRIIDLQMRAPQGIASAFAPEPAHARFSPLEGGGGRSELSLDKTLMRRIEIAAGQTGCSIRRAAVACMPGPAYETPAEVVFLQSIGADLAAMSAAVEVICANRLGMRAAVLCLVTNYATGMARGFLSHGEVLAMGEKASHALGDLLVELMRGL